MLAVPERELKQHLVGFAAGFGTGRGHGDDFVVGRALQAQAGIMLAEVKKLLVGEPGQGRAVQHHHVVDVGESHRGKLAGGDTSEYTTTKRPPRHPGAAVAA